MTRKGASEELANHGKFSMKNCEDFFAVTIRDFLNSFQLFDNFHGSRMLPVPLDECETESSRKRFSKRQ